MAATDSVFIQRIIAVSVSRDWEASGLQGEPMLFPLLNGGLRGACCYSCAVWTGNGGKSCWKEKVTTLRQAESS